jgi:hypothetical protein
MIGQLMNNEWGRIRNNVVTVVFGGIISAFAFISVKKPGIKSSLC